MGAEQIFWTKWTWKPVSEWRNIWHDSIQLDGNDKTANQHELAQFNLKTMAELLAHKK